MRSVLAHSTILARSIRRFGLVSDETSFVLVRFSSQDWLSEDSVCALLKFSGPWVRLPIGTYCLNSFIDTLIKGSIVFCLLLGGGKLSVSAFTDAFQNTTSDQDLEEMHAECNVLRARLGDIEEQMAQTRENHRRLVEETRQHRIEVEELRSQRAQLEAALTDSQTQIVKLRDAQQNPRSGAVNHITSNVNSAYVTEPMHTDRLELAPGRLVTVRLNSSQFVN